MRNLQIDFDTYDMTLSILVNDEEKRHYKVQMEYSYIDEKKVFDIDSNTISEQYIFAYSLNEKGIHTLNDKSVDIYKIKDKDISTLLKNILIVNSELERELLKSEFKDFFYLLIDNIEDDFKDCLLINDIY